MGTDWFRHAIIYQILIDRFSRGRQQDLECIECNGPIFCGGNLRGVIERLDYLADLGVNAIWLSPFNSTTAYHGYHTTDFFKVEPRFGTIEDLDELIESAHVRGMRLIMDFVPNHVHKSHPFFREAMQDPASKYRTWFYFGKGNNYLRFLDIEELPKLNLSDPAARQHVTTAAIYWLDRGIDGLRLDHVAGPSNDFWEQFVTSIKSRHPDTVLIGEAFLSGLTWKTLKTVNVSHKRLILWLTAAGIDTTAIAMRQYAGILDGVLDFRVQNLLKRFVAKPVWYRPGNLLRVLLKA
ncbi:MAG TPA: alpha-amylase family glycosyl hydrolase, partial [Blastocatellia bacterium]|nr:alpha-amylase family glycosyl hydrolase [Blastocatellia bacterium]